MKNIIFINCNGTNNLTLLVIMYRIRLFSDYQCETRNYLEITSGSYVKRRFALSLRIVVYRCAYGFAFTLMLLHRH